VRLAPETQAIATPSGARTTAASARAAGPRRRGGTSAETTTVPGTSMPTRISEHDPIWHEAVVHVESVEKGSTRQKQVVVRFPGSNDVRWRNHPKFRPGQQGVFLLNAVSPRGKGAARPQSVVSARGARVSTTSVSLPQGAMQAMVAAQPISAIERVRQLLTTPKVSTRSARRRRR
jgi:hypothetical protein